MVAASVVVATGVAFLVSLGFESFLRAFLDRREDPAFHRAMGELVSAGDSEGVADRLLPHVCALVGASQAALLAGDGTVVARHPLWLENERAEPWRPGPGTPRDANGATGAGGGRITVRTSSGASHALVVQISPYLPTFGHEELRRLDLLADMVGLAIERCEMAELMAFHASHDVLTGLANRALFMERLEEALGHVGVGAPPWPCSSSIWTASSWSTTGPTTARVTPSSTRWRRGSRP